MAAVVVAAVCKVKMTLQGEAYVMEFLIHDKID
jgi:hypothetical protein